MAKQIIGFIKKLTNNFKKRNQRICIVIDRRWRIKTKKFSAYNKLRNYGRELRSEEGEPEPKKPPSGWGWSFSGKNKKNDNNKEQKENNDNNDNKDGFDADFYNVKHDTIYVYQADLLKKSNRSYHEFKEDYCHETLIYLTKLCIIPRMDHYMHVGGDTTDGWFFNVSVHIEMAKRETWYKYDQRWYLFLQSAALRFFPQDITILWPKYFTESDEDPEKFTKDKIEKSFAFNLEESDPSYKRWYYAIKRSD